MKTSEVQIRDPFIVPMNEEKTYYLFGTTDKNAWGGPGLGFDTYRSRDLQEWEGPIPAFRPGKDFWGTTQFWAPEVYRYEGRFFMFATFHGDGGCRGTQILAADRPEGPYVPWSDRAVTPQDWDCLDGTLHVDAKGDPWIVFCHEWVQIHDGAICAARLGADLKSRTGAPICLFHASEAPWVLPFQAPGTEPGPIKDHVTDGPFLYTTRKGALFMLWSSFGTKGYAMGVARSASGTVEGPWVHEAKPIWKEDGGHGMIFRAFDGRLFLTFHQPNDSPNERAVFRELREGNDSVELAAGD